jgi:hypothetical protein
MIIVSVRKLFFFASDHPTAALFQLQYPANNLVVSVGKSSFPRLEEPGRLLEVNVIGCPIIGMIGMSEVTGSIKRCVFWLGIRCG